MTKCVNVSSFALVAGVLTVFCGICAAQSISAGHGRASSAMWNMAYYHQTDSDASKFPISAIPWSKYTHVAHGCIYPEIDKDGGPKVNASGYHVDVNAKTFTSEAHKNGVKALISLVVGGDGTVKGIMNNTSPEHIDKFVAEITQFINDNGYDGIDVDWESGKDTPRIVSFVTKLREAMPRPKYVITYAVGAYFRDAMTKVADQLDQINIMVYDMQGGNYEGKPINYAWYNTSVLAGPGVKMGDFKATKSLEHEVWWMVVDGKVPVEKLGVLVPFYGRIKQAPRKGGTRGVTRPGEVFAPGTYPSPDISWAKLMNSKYWTDGEKHWDDLHKASYISYHGASAADDAFISYTDPRQIMEFVKWAKAHSLGGMGCFALAYEYIPDAVGDERCALSAALYKAVISTPAELEASLKAEAKAAGAARIGPAPVSK